MNKMHIFKVLMAIVITAALLTACKKTDDDITPSLMVNPTTKSLDENEGSFTFEVASNLDWTASIDYNWATITPTKGSGNATVKVEYTKNTGASARNATILVKGNNVPDKTVSITQNGISPTLSVTPSNQNVSSDAGNASFSIISNTTWIASSDVLWCTLSQTSGTGNADLIAFYTGNTLPEARSANIIITAQGITRGVTVSQSKFSPSLSISPQNQDVTNAAGTTSFTVTSNIAWTASVDSNWCTITNPGGTGNGSLTVTYEANINASPRIATITLKDTGSTLRTVTITQQSGLPTQGLVAYYPFNGNALDESGNSNNGTVWGATLTSDRKGNENSAYYFNGINNWIEVPNNQMLNPPAISISVWVQYGGPNSSSAIWMPFLFKQNTRTNYCEGYALSINKPSSKYYGTVSSCDGSQKNNLCIESSNINEWVHIVFVANSSKTIIYKNSIYQSTLLTGFSLCYNNLPLYIGKASNEYFKGIIDDIRIYNRALTETEIQALYNE